MVTTSPFRQQDLSNTTAQSPPDAASTKNSSENTVNTNGNSQTRSANQPIGKIKINDQFLQSSSQSNQMTKPASNGGGGGFRSNNFGTVSKTSVYQAYNSTVTTVVNGGERKQENQSSSNTSVSQQETHIVETVSIQQEQVKLVETVSVAPPTAAASIKPPAFLRHQSEENDEEWGENIDAPVEVAPTYGVAPLASYDETEESFSSLNRSQQQQQQHSANNTSLTYQEQFVSVEAYAEQHITTTATSSNGHHKIEEPQHEKTNGHANGDSSLADDSTGMVAVALYDYQAADEDEISFDPNDVITHIEQVIFCLIGEFSLLKNI